MAARVCPRCLKPIPARYIAAFSDGEDCPHCHTRVEVSPYSRMPATVVGMFAAWLVWRLTQGAGGVLGPVLPELYAILAFGIVSPLVLMFTADWQLAPVAPVVEQAASAGHGHAASHH